MTRLQTTLVIHLSTTAGSLNGDLATLLSVFFKFGNVCECRIELELLETGGNLTSALGDFVAYIEEILPVNSALSSKVDFGKDTVRDIG